MIGDDVLDAREPGVAIGADVKLQMVANDLHCAFSKGEGDVTVVVRIRSRCFAIRAVCTCAAYLVTV